MHTCLKIFLICLMSLAPSVCHSYPVLFKILYHPTTKSVVGMIGDTHYTYHGQEGEQRELEFHNVMHDLHTTVQQHTYKVFFEGNKNIAQEYQQKKIPTLGLGSFCNNEQKNPALYKGIDPRTDSLRIYAKIIMRYNKIAQTVKDEIILVLQDLLEHLHVSSLKKSVSQEMTNVKNESNAHTIVNAYLYTPQKSFYIPLETMHKILLKALALHTDCDCKTLTTYCLDDIFQQLSTLLDTCVQQLKKQSPYSTIITTINKQHQECLIAIMSLYKEWYELVNLKQPLLQGLIALGKAYGNSFNIFESTTKQRTTINFFFSHICLASLFDCIGASHILNETKSVLYAGANHCLGITATLCNAENGFVQIYAVGSDDKKSRLSAQDFSNFCTTLQKYSQDPTIPHSIAEKSFRPYQQQQQQNLKKA